MGGFPGGMGTPGAPQPQGGAGGLAVPTPLYNTLVELLKSKA